MGRINVSDHFRLRLAVLFRANVLTLINNGLLNLDLERTERWRTYRHARYCCLPGSLHAGRPACYIEHIILNLFGDVQPWRRLTDSS